MGHPKKQRKMYERPSHPWQKQRIIEEKEISKKYGLRNKKDIWRLSTLLSKYKRQAKKLSALDTKQSQLETRQLMDKLKSYGLIQEESYDAVLSMELENLMDRRLQTMLVTKKLARSSNQARQMITHGHVAVSGKTIDSPSYLVKINEEDNLSFNDKSPFVKEDHPERLIKQEIEELNKEVEMIKANPESNDEGEKTNEVVDSENKEVSEK